MSIYPFFLRKIVENRRKYPRIWTKNTRAGDMLRVSVALGLCWAHFSGQPGGLTRRAVQLKIKKYFCAAVYIGALPCCDVFPLLQPAPDPLRRWLFVRRLCFLYFLCFVYFVHCIHGRCYFHASLQQNRTAARLGAVLPCLPDRLQVWYPLHSRPVLYLPLYPLHSPPSALIRFTVAPVYLSLTCGQRWTQAAGRAVFLPDRRSSVLQCLAFCHTLPEFAIAL